MGRGADGTGLGVRMGRVRGCSWVELGVRMGTGLGVQLGRVRGADG